MFTIILTFILFYIIGWVIGFVDVVTNGKIRWVMGALVLLFFIYLVSKVGLSFAVVIFIVIAVLIVKFVWNTIKGAIYGILSIFTNRF